MALYEPPVGLGLQGSRLWKVITEENDLRTDELRVLEDACREVDLIERMHAELQDAQLVVKGSMGQDVANPLVQELRQHRALVARLLAALKLQDDEAGEERDRRARSSQARQAALVRWGRAG
ncbi:P27 family phage terminase small subunit [Streptomyces sp. NBC_01264]|uniref:P27 family phage terminase small subunit n=1 Tax=Streptomyces sp. NBC_01264 TaxID=2903804 RepID=UPI002255858F|nr:P27 family phage terminase small subunit [Streptomyces sp. NBC_01264]MCX4780907.1 hypothetical protein [Streptomyces sp. NBC_01264]